MWHQFVFGIMGAIYDITDHMEQESPVIVAMLQGAESRRAGLTLVEVIVGLFLFSLTSLGLTASLIQSLKVSDQVLSRSTAHSIALGYSEQLMAYSYNELRDALSLGTGFTLVATSLGDSTVSTVEQTFVFGQQQQQLIVMDIDRESQEPIRSMPTRLTINATSLNSGGTPLSALEITIDYSYLRSGVSESNDAAWGTGSVKAVKSLVDIY
ncbi:MAG TPA: hypothetical protein DEA90_11710 [Opitutae bacterium]|nr:hypothetical protein [Puniceicoccaceae bacterium]HBR94818.1 hypothetical protein [Opitutae bacterium]|tara:strand:- start:7227 stop:7859 length:633 start_codon:yes stop_codon:yes gene_type:complete